MKLVFGVYPRFVSDEAGVNSIRAAVLASIIAVGITGGATVFDPNIKYKFLKLNESVNTLSKTLSLFLPQVALGSAIASEGSDVTNTSANVAGDTVSTLDKDSGTKRVDSGTVNDTASRANGSGTISITDLFAAFRSFGRRTMSTFSATDLEFSRGFTKSVANSANAAEKKASELRGKLKSGVSLNATKYKSDDDYSNWSKFRLWIQSKATDVSFWWKSKYPQFVLWIEKRGMFFYGLLVVLLALEIVILRVVQGALWHSNRRNQLDEWHENKKKVLGQEQPHASGVNLQDLDNATNLSAIRMEEDDGPLSELQATRNELEQLRAELEQLSFAHLDTQNLLGQKQTELQDSLEELAKLNAIVGQKQAELENLREELDRAKAELSHKQVEGAPSANGQPEGLHTTPEVAQEALTRAKEEAGRALEGWISARNDAEYARAETEQLRREQKAAQERAEQTQAELAVSKEELAMVKADADRTQAEAASLREEKQHIQDRFCQSQKIIEKAQNDFVQAQKDLLEIRKKQLSSQQQALKACEKLMRKEYERLHSQEEGLNANLQELEDQSLPTHSSAEAAVLNKGAQGQLVVDEEKAGATKADDPETTSEQVALPDPIVERARKELTQNGERIANSQKTAVTAKNLNSLIRAEHDRLRSQEKVINAPLEELMDLSQLDEHPAVAALRNDETVAQSPLNAGREVITDEGHEEPQPKKLAKSDESAKPGGFPGRKEMANSQEITITSRNLEALRGAIAK